MLKKETNSTKFTSSKINCISNAFNIISSVFLFIIFLGIIFDKINGHLSKNILTVLVLNCSFIPLLLSIILKFVFDIIEGRNVLQSKIVKSGLLFFIFNILLFVLTIIIFIIFIIYSNKSEEFLEKYPFFRYFYFIISLLGLIIAIFAIVERIRKKNKIHLFFLIFYTTIIITSFVSSIVLLIAVNKNKDTLEL